jgi:hypothetical protein
MSYLVFLKRLRAWIWVAGFLAGLSAAGPASVPKGDTAAEPDFTGKVLAVVCKDSQGAGCLLEKVQVRQLGSQRFLVGRVVDEGTGKNPAAGSTFWIAVAEVARMWEFKDVEEARKFFRSFPGATAAKMVEGDVWECPTRDFAMPLYIPPCRRTTIAKVRLFVSVDGGKTWEHHQDCGPDEERFRFSAPRDGTYWFALQTVSKDGKKEPADTKGLAPLVKVRVNVERPSPKVEKGPQGSQAGDEGKPGEADKKK